MSSFTFLSFSFSRLSFSYEDIFLGFKVTRKLIVPVCIWAVQLPTGTNGCWNPFALSASQNCQPQKPLVRFPWSFAKNLFGASRGSMEINVPKDQTLP